MGRASLMEAPRELTIYPDTAFRLRPDPTRADSAWLAFVWNAPQVRRRIERKARTTAGIWKIRQADVIDHKLPLPSIEEQHEIVRILHESLGRIDALTRIAMQALDNLERLRETLLSQAFRGELAKNALEGLSRTTLAELRLRATTAENDWAPASAGPQQEGPVEMSRILKSRLDSDVRDKPYLANLLKSGGEESLSAKALFALTELSVADFYKQLMWELGHRHLVENGDEFRAASSQCPSNSEQRLRTSALDRPASTLPDLCEFAQKTTVADGHDLRHCSRSPAVCLPITTWISWPPSRSSWSRGERDERSSSAQAKAMPDARGPSEA